LERFLRKSGFVSKNVKNRLSGGENFVFKIGHIRWEFYVALKNRDVLLEKIHPKM
jgi:hypothetical protein